jgi:K+-sensing histidine kinase KdpD
LTGEDVAGELLRFAREHGITLVLFGKSKMALWRRLVTKSPIDTFAGGGTGVDVLEIETEPA